MEKWGAWAEKKSCQIRTRALGPQRCARPRQGKGLPVNEQRIKNNTEWDVKQRLRKNLGPFCSREEGGTLLWRWDCRKGDAASRHGETHGVSTPYAGERARSERLIRTQQRTGPGRICCGCPGCRLQGEKSPGSGKPKRGGSVRFFPQERRDIQVLFGVDGQTCRGRHRRSSGVPHGDIVADVGRLVQGAGVELQLV